METTTYNDTVLMESIKTKDVSESGRGSSSKNHLRSSPPVQGVASNAPAAASLGMSVVDALLESKASCRGMNSPCDERDAESGCKDRARSQSRSFARTELRDRNEIRLGTTQDDQSSHPSRAHPANKDGRFISKSKVVHKPLSSERRNKVATTTRIMRKRKAAPEPGSLSYDRVAKRATGKMKQNSNLANAHKESFPLILHRMINETDASIVWWDETGKAVGFDMANEKLPGILFLYFGKDIKVESFRRQLNTYGFSKHSKGSYLGHYYHMHFDRNSTKEELLNIRRRVSGQVEPKAPVNRASRTILKKTRKCVRKSLPTASTRSLAYDKRTPQRKSESGPPVVTAPRRRHHKCSQETGADIPNPIQPSGVVMPANIALSYSRFHRTRNDLLPFEQYSGPDGRDIIEPLAIMSLPLIKTPRKHDFFASPCVKEYFSEVPGALTFVSTETANAVSFPAGPGAHVDVMARQFVSAVSHAWDFTPPIGDTIHADNMTAMSMTSSIQGLRYGFDGHGRQVVISGATSDHANSWYAPFTETSPIVPLDSNHGFHGTAVGEFDSGRVDAGHASL